MIEVVGLQASGWASLGRSERDMVASADVLLGSPRQLALVPAVPGQERCSWPRPLQPGLAEFVAGYAGRRLVALASGDPLVAGIGSTLIDLLGRDQVRVHPGVSSVALARARMGWPAESCATVRLVEPGADPLRAQVAPGRRLVVLSRDAGSPAAIATVLVDQGYGASAVTVLADLGTAREWRHDTTATGGVPADVPGLNLVCIECHADRLTEGSTAPGLPDEAFEHDGQLTKRDLRASALSRLRPAPGQLLWDLGAGAGSVSVEWLRSHPSCRAVAVERDPDRAERIRRNAARLGVPQLEVRCGEVDDLPTGPAPDVVFVGGGLSASLGQAAWSRLQPGGRLVAHAVTLESETVLVELWRHLGGELHRIAVEELQPLGHFHAWKPARAVVQWSAIKPMEEASSP